MAAGNKARQAMAPSPWASHGANSLDPRAAGIPRYGTGGGQQRVEVTLPPWLKIDAHCCYLSKSTGKVMEVIVEMVNHQKCEVEITFVEDTKVWKVIPFSVIGGNDSPLLGPWKQTGNATAGAPLSTVTNKDAGSTGEASAANEER